MIKVKIIIEAKDAPDFIIKAVRRQRAVLSYLKGEMGIEKLKELGIEFTNPFETKSRINIFSFKEQILNMNSMVKDSKSINMSLFSFREIGIELFGNKENFLLWLKTPNQALGDIKPITSLKSQRGKEMVLIILMRIKYGIYS